VKSEPAEAARKGGNRTKLNWMTRACGVFLLWATAAASLPAQTFTTLFNFDGMNGMGPSAGLVQGTDGNFYGTTEFGGANNACPTGCGTVFKITPCGALTTLHSFEYGGFLPVAGLVQGASGDFYGTTLYGGTNSSECAGSSCGTVFKISSSGILTTLHTFVGMDGFSPWGTLVQGTDGNFYGTTEFGGASDSCGGFHCGTVFQISPSGTLTTLHSFDRTDGFEPVAALIQASDGSFYGTTMSGGGSENCVYGCGTVFEITPSGTLTTLHSFRATDGSYPSGALVQAANGDVYGTTGQGGTSVACDGDPCGTIFRITPSGALTTLLSFDDTDGEYPYAGLVQATEGNFYGTTLGGTAFTITPGGRLTTLFNFDGTDGESPYGGLIQATDGSFYGTTYIGGNSDACPFGNAECGTVFSLSVGLLPFVETRPTSSMVEAPVQILGNDLTGATSVTFNGTSAVFTVVSSALITTTVPAGATTGTVQVVTLSGTLSSNLPFIVRP
jgi:uncharacterized repeat protein (TIGR03803 family)